MKTYTKKLATFALAVCLIGAFAGYAAAASNGITVTVTPSTSTVTFDCNVSTWDIGSVNYGAAEETQSAIAVNNTGNGPIDVSIQLDESGTDWTGAATAGEDQFVMNATQPTGGTTDSTSVVNGITTSEDTSFIVGLSPSDGVNSTEFDLSFLMPASGTTTAQQTITITLTSSAS